MPQTLIKNIIRQLDELDNGSRWFDQCFKEKLSSVSDTEAFIRPVPAVHSVAEQVSHIIAWRQEALRRFKQERTDLMNSAEDWRENTELMKTGWQNLKDQLYESTADLISVLENKDDTFLEIIFRDTDYNFHYVIEGIIQHDLYHLGQIGVTIKLLQQKVS